jgi:rhomboid protease GluP
MIVLLLAVFAAERRLAFDIDRNGQISLESLIAFGGASYDRIVGAGEWWRLFLAPLLHASYSHVIGNCIALFFVGLRLESMIGRAWVAAIFAFSALGGEVGSLLGNAPAVTTVGASGAISGLIGALFVVSFETDDPILQRKMLWTSARFGAPALAPLIFGASGHVDYYAHSGGAVAGAAAGWALSAIWPVDRHRPDFTREAAVASLVGLAASIAACFFAAAQFSGHFERAAQFIPSSEMPEGLKLAPGKSSELLARYPRDPRSHIAQAIALMRAHDLPGAEAELRTALTLGTPDAADPSVKDATQALLAIVVAGEGRRREAKAMIADLCHARDKAKGRVGDLLDNSKLCD